MRCRPFAHRERGKWLLPASTREQTIDALLPQRTGPEWLLVNFASKAAAALFLLSLGFG
jgi:hypothetical protein